jgi:hypothetical protein
MDFIDFYTYNNDCPVCGGELVCEASLLCFIDVGHKYHSGVCGIEYMYCDYHDKFEKSDVFYTKNHKATANKLFAAAINSFTVNKRFYPHFGRSKMERSLKQGIAIAAIELTYEKCCVNPVDEKSKDFHQYRYNSGALYADAVPVNNDELYLEYESINKFGYSIDNLFFDNVVHSTNIRSLETKKRTDFLAIPLDKWDLSSKDSLEKQIEKYTLLK